MSQTPPQQFCVRWNSYHTNLQNVFPKLLTTENFVDVTLACENQQIKCHKVVLSACSTYFERLLIQNPCKHPIIFMKDMRFSEMQSLVDFMYRGEVNVSQDDLPSLLKSAEALQIRGLCGSDTGLGATATENSTSSIPSTDGIALNTQDIVNKLNGSSSNGLSSSAQKRRRDVSSPESLSDSFKNVKRSSKTNGDSNEAKEETVEEDGLFYGEMDNDDMECTNQNEDEMVQGLQNQPVIDPFSGQSLLRHLQQQPKTEDPLLSAHQALKNMFYNMVSGQSTAEPPPETEGLFPDLNLESQNKSYKRYTSLNLKQALISVKNGTSVYGAAKKYGIPKKTLRNWMQKYNIKSQFSREKKGAQVQELINDADLANFAIANVTCEYDTSRSPSPIHPVTSTNITNDDHNYQMQSSSDNCEPPAFIIKQERSQTVVTSQNSQLNQQLLAMSRKLLAATSSGQLNSHQPQAISSPQLSALQQYNSQDAGNNKRIRRSEIILKQAADCVSRGQTFQNVSDQFNIPISTIRFFMARKGILPRRKRGRSSAAQPMSPTQPPYHMASYKLPDLDIGKVS